METKSTRLEKTGISYINRMAGTMLGHVVAYYLISWKISNIGAGIYFGIFILTNIMNIALLYRYNLRLLNERGKIRKDTASEEKILVPLMVAFTYGFPSIVAGIETRSHDAGRSDPVLIIAGLFLLLLSGILENWAMLANRHFERNIRIQGDRDHTVITGGPYRYVRHPGYLGYILRLAAFPLMLGSVYSIIPVGIGIIVHIARTNIEDNLLKKELNGYASYADRTRYRLIPFIW